MALARKHLALLAAVAVVGATAFVVLRARRQDPGDPPPGAPAQLLDIAYAELSDLDASGDASAGDEVVLQLERALPSGTEVRPGDLPLVSPDDRWGEGAEVRVGAGRRKAVAAGPPREVRVVLGHGARLRLYDTYRPGRAGTMPALVRAVGGAVPILVRAADRRSFVGDRFPDAPDLRAFYGQLHAHTSLSDGVLQPSDAFAMARQWGLDFFAVTDHLEQIAAEGAWDKERAQADAATVPGAFVALAGYEWGGAPSAHGWINHVNVLGSDALLGVMGTMTLGGLYDGIRALPGAAVVGQFNHPGMEKPVVGRNNWDDFDYAPAADLRMKSIMVATRSRNSEDNRESIGYVPALDRGWHLAPKGEEDNHQADWGRSPVRTGLWLPALTREAVLAGLLRMAAFYTDDPRASVKLVADGRWLMGSTVYGAGPHRLEVEVLHRGRIAAVSRVEIVTRGGAVLSAHSGGTTPLRVSFDVAPEGDAYFFARVVLEDEAVRLLSAPIFVDR